MNAGVVVTFMNNSSANDLPLFGGAFFAGAAPPFVEPKESSGKSTAKSSEPPNPPPLPNPFPDDVVVVVSNGSLPKKSPMSVDAFCGCLCTTRLLVCCSGGLKLIKPASGFVFVLGLVFDVVRSTSILVGLLISCEMGLTGGTSPEPDSSYQIFFTYVL